MNVYRHINEFSSKKNVAITTGTFDGVHLGHKKIIEQVVSAAKKNKWRIGYFNFFSSSSNGVVPRKQ